ncbi:MAG: hypothetical protein HY782_09925 [Chloroflexi bacterium]|nr:hypothetical protein [Chloroflexota bacterium]
MTLDTTSFVLRFTREIAEDEQARWRGTINHVQSDTKLNFTQFTKALQFMREQLGKEVPQEFFNAELTHQVSELETRATET